MNTPNFCLFTAVSNKNIKEVVRILSQNNKHFVKGTDSTYLLGNAAEKGYLKIVQILLNAGVEPFK